MGLGEWSIDYMLRVRSISQCMHSITMDSIITLFTISSLNHDRYPGVNICYLTGDAALVNCSLIDLSGLLSSEETRKQTLVLPSAPPPTASVNRVSNTP